MKGISTVFTFILVLLILVSLITLSFIWFTYVLKDVEFSSTTQMNRTIEEMQSDFEIVTLTKVSETEIIVYVRNTGSSDISLENVAAYIDNNELGLDC